MERSIVTAKGAHRISVFWLRAAKNTANEELSPEEKRESEFFFVNDIRGGIKLAASSLAEGKLG